MKRHLIFIALVFLLITSSCFLFSQNGSENEVPATKYLIGVSQSGLIDSWKVAMNREIEQTAKSFPDCKLIFTDAAGDHLKQIEDIEMLVSCGIDLLIISPEETEPLINTINRVSESIPVIVLAPQIEGVQCRMFISPDNVKIGQMAGDLLAQELGHGGGNVVEILGPENSLSVLQREQAFHETLTKYPNIQVVKKLYANWMRDEAEDRLKEYMIVEQPKFDAVFAQSDTMAEGAKIATEKLRYDGDILFFGVGGMRTDFGYGSSVLTDAISGTIFCPTGGQQAIDCAIKILNGDTALPTNMILEPYVISHSLEKG